MRRKQMTRNDMILDVPAIQKNIRTRHEKFIKEFGPAAEKVMADHRLFADLVMAKLYRIALIFKEEKIIDEIKMTEDGPYKKICLSKVGNVTYVNVITNGLVIVLEGLTYADIYDTGFKYPKEKFMAVNSNKFDWIDFATKLLDYIHSRIYERKEAMETRLNGMLQPFPFNDSEKVINELKPKKSKNDNK